MKLTAMTVLLILAILVTMPDQSRAHDCNCEEYDEYVSDVNSVRWVTCGFNYDKENHGDHGPSEAQCISQYQLQKNMQDATDQINSALQNIHENRQQQDTGYSSGSGTSNLNNRVSYDSLYETSLKAWWENWDGNDEILEACREVFEAGKNFSQTSGILRDAEVAARAGVEAAAMAGVKAAGAAAARAALATADKYTWTDGDALLAARASRDAWVAAGAKDACRKPWAANEEGCKDLKDARAAAAADAGAAEDAYALAYDLAVAAFRQACVKNTRKCRNDSMAIYDDDCMKNTRKCKGAIWDSEAAADAEDAYSADAWDAFFAADLAANAANAAYQSCLSRKTAPVSKGKNKSEAASGKPTVDENLKAIQAMLNECGFGAGPMDGLWGRKTESAAANFIRDHGGTPAGEKSSLLAQVDGHRIGDSGPCPETDVEMAVRILEEREGDPDDNPLDLGGLDLAGGDFSGKDFGRDDLSQANLEGADMTGADLSETNLKKTNLKDAILDRANLAGQDLRETVLEGASLAGAALSGARFSPASGLTMAQASVANWAGKITE